MGKVVKSVTKAVTKAVKKTVKTVGKTAKSFATAGFDGVKSLAKGDLNGVADAAIRASSGGTVSLQGKGGIINSSMLKTPQEQVLNNSGVEEEKPEGLLAYVDSQRNRRAKRSRQSTNNTNGSYSDGNKLSGTTALGV